MNTKTCSIPECAAIADVLVAVVQRRQLILRQECCKEHARQILDQHRTHRDSNGNVITKSQPSIAEFELDTIQYHLEGMLHDVELVECFGVRKLHLQFGPFETSAILNALRIEKPLRPLTYDLVIDLVRAANATINGITIFARPAPEGFHLALVSVERTMVSARPSDAIALALHGGLPIMVSYEGDQPSTADEGKLGCGLAVERCANNSNVETVNERSPLFSASYSFRRPRTLRLIGGYLVALGSLFAILAVAVEYASRPPILVAAALVLGSVGAFLIGTPLVGWLTNRTVDLTIDMDGIRYGSTIWKWNRIKRFEITAEPWSNTLCVLLWTGSKGGPGRALPTDAKVSAEDMASLTTRARTYLKSTTFTGTFGC